MADNRHIKNNILATSPRFTVRLTHVEAESRSYTCHVTKIADFENLNCRTAAILTIFMLSHIYIYIYIYIYIRGAVIKQQI